MCHKAICIFGFGVQLFQFFGKGFDIRFFKIKFAGIALRDNISV